MSVKEGSMKKFVIIVAVFAAVAFAGWTWDDDSAASASGSAIICGPSDGAEI
jgi:hypothetical protein